MSPAIRATAIEQTGSAIGTETGPQSIENCPGTPGDRPDPLSRRLADDALICQVACCCSATPNKGAIDQNLFQGCVSDAFGQADKGLNYTSRYKPEISYNMQTDPPEPFMHRENKENTTEPSRYWRSRLGEIDNYQVGQGMVRRPDLVIVDDPCIPPEQTNIERVVEFKFFEDQRDRKQDDAYVDIAGDPEKYSVFRIGAQPAKDEQGCDCDGQKRPEPVVAPATQRESERESPGALGSAASAVGWSVVTAAAGVATAALALVPFDGPAGELIAGAATAAAATRAAAAWRVVGAAF